MAEGLRLENWIGGRVIVNIIMEPADDTATKG